MSFPEKGGPRRCPMEGCPGKMATRTVMRVHFVHRHVLSTMVMLEEGKSPPPTVRQVRHARSPGGAYSAPSVGPACRTWRTVGGGSFLPPVSPRFSGHAPRCQFPRAPLHGASLRSPFCRKGHPVLLWGPVLRRGFPLASLPRRFPMSSNQMTLH